MAFTIDKKMTNMDTFVSHNFRFNFSFGEGGFDFDNSFQTTLLSHMSYSMTNQIALLVNFEI